MTIFNEPRIFEEKFIDLQLSSQVIEEVTFNNCSFQDCNLSDASFIKCGFENCHFDHCDLSLIKLPQTLLKNTIFNHCRMMGINWCQASWNTQSLLTKKRIDFDNCLLDHSLFIGLDLSETNFLNCKARQVDFEGANLEGADFSDTDLEGARFINCDLSLANFIRAINYAVDAGQNKLHETRFSLPEAISLLHSLDIILEERE